MAGSARRQPTAILVLAAWHEGVPPRLVARIRWSLDPARAERATFEAAGLEEIAAFVREWLEQVDAAATDGDADVTEE